MTRHFVPPGGKPPEKPPIIPIFLGWNDPPTKKPRKPRDLVIGKPWPVEDGR
jgi:hypothetical protein